MSPPITRAELEDIYRRCGFQIERRCAALLRDPDAGRDAAQECFVKLMTHGDEFRGEADWMTWLYRVATNICLNRMRDHGNRQRLLDQHGEVLEPGGLSTPDRVQHQRALVRIMQHFDETTVEIALYHFVDELSQQEIGELVGLSRVSVNKRLQKFRARARELLEQDEAA